MGTSFFVVVVFVPPRVSGGYEVWFYHDYASTTTCCHSSFVLDMGYLSLVGSSILLLMVFQQLVVILVLLQERMSTCPSTLSSCFYFCTFNTTSNKSGESQHLYPVPVLKGNAFSFLPLNIMLAIWACHIWQLWQLLHCDMPLLCVPHLELLS